MQKCVRRRCGLLWLYLFSFGVAGRSLGATPHKGKPRTNLVTPGLVGYFRSPDRRYSVKEIHDDGDTATVVVIERRTGRELVRASDVQSFNWIPRCPHRLVVGASGLYGEGMLAMWEGGTHWHYLVRVRHPADESFTVQSVSRDGRCIIYMHQQGDDWVVTGKERRIRLRLPPRLAHRRRDHVYQETR